jgi:hypothetical protein
MYACMAMSVICGCCVTGVGVHYTELTCKGKTLKDERGRKKFLAGEESYSCERWMKTLCGPRVPSVVVHDQPIRYLDRVGDVQTV